MNKGDPSAENRVLLGRSEQVDVNHGISMTAACPTCCPNSFDHGYVDPAGVTGFAGGFTQFTAWEVDFDCYTNSMESFNPGAVWNSSNTSVATCNETGGATAVGPGSTSINASWFAPQWFQIFEECQFSGVDNTSSASCDVGPHINSISPGRGPVGTTVSISIFGYGFDPNGSKFVNISGSGVSASEVNQIEGGVIAANLTLTDTATAGNHDLTIAISGFTSNSVNFFVQVPTSFSPVSLSTANLGCPANTVGFGGQVLYEVLDQQGQTANAAGWTPQEHFTVNGNPAFSGFRSFATPSTTNSQGRFLDIPVGTCFGAQPPPNLCVDVVQTFNILVGSTTYNIGTTTTRRDCMQGIRVSVTNGGTTQSSSLGTVN